MYSSQVWTSQNLGRGKLFLSQLHGTILNEEQFQKLDKKSIETKTDPSVLFSGNNCIRSDWCNLSLVRSNSAERTFGCLREIKSSRIKGCFWSLLNRQSKEERRAKIFYPTFFLWQTKEITWFGFLVQNRNLDLGLFAISSKITFCEVDSSNWRSQVACVVLMGTLKMRYAKSMCHVI